MRRCSDDLPNVIDEVILQTIYGNLRKPPGDKNSSFDQLSLTTEEGITISGVWAPPNSLAKAAALKLLFPTITLPFKLAYTEPIPPYLIIGYDAFKYKDIMELMKQYPGEVMKYGFFTSDIPSEAQLIAKTVDIFENKTIPTSYEEKIVIQLAKRNNDCMFAFSELGPSYISSNVVQAEEESKLFFPDGYDIPEENTTTTKKKSKKKSKSIKPIQNDCSDMISLNNPKRGDTTAESETDHGENDEHLIEGELDDHEDRASEEKNEPTVEEIDIIKQVDKSTSPVEKVIIK